MTDPRTRLVGEGYDAMADTWEAWSAQVVDPRGEWLEEFVARVPDGGRVVELGCGNGTAETRVLAERYRLTGVDLSGEQLRRARERVPEADYIEGDFTAIEFDAGSLDGVVAFYSFNHVPRDLLPRVFANVHGWLRPGGVFVASLGARDLPDWTGDFLGAPNFFSGWPPEKNRELLRDAGFALARDELVTIQEPEGPQVFHWVVATR